MVGERAIAAFRESVERFGEATEDGDLVEHALTLALSQPGPEVGTAGTERDRRRRERAEARERLGYRVPRAEDEERIAAWVERLRTLGFAPQTFAKEIKDEAGRVVDRRVTVQCRKRPVVKGVLGQGGIPGPIPRGCSVRQV